MSLKYAVIGTGALGGFYGGMLAQSGKDVHFLFHNDYEFVKEHGLRVDSVKGDFLLNEVQAYKSTSGMPLCDVVLVCLKTVRNGLLKNLLAPILHKNSVVILIQNGLGIEADLAEEMPTLNIAGGLAFICSNKVGPGHITHLDYGRLNLGSYNLRDEIILKQVCEDFEQSGVPAKYSSNLMLARWEKLVWNIPFNGMTVVLNTTTDRLMANGSTRKLIEDMMLEVVHAANHCGVPLKESFVNKMIEMTDTMKPYAPSMKLDYDYKRPMEIEYIYSHPVVAALESGFDMKKVKMLEQQLRFIQTTY